MSTNPVNGWDLRLSAATETSLGNMGQPANPTAYAAQFGPIIDANLGAIEQGQTRPTRDRNLGRGDTSLFVEGRVQPIPFSVDVALRSRSAIDADFDVIVKQLMAAAGIKRTVNGATSLVYSTSATPAESSDWASCTLTAFKGSGLATLEAETLRGCLVTGVHLEGGDKEVLVKFTGKGIGKQTQGAIDSITLATTNGTSLTHTAEESYRLDAGWYLCESEVILIANRTDVGYGTTTTTIARAQLGTSGATHTAKPLVPYIPPGIAFTGSPIAEPNATVTFGGVTLRCLSWSIDIATGADMLPGETGSAYVQGVKFGRYSMKGGFRLALKGDNVSLAGKAMKRATAGAMALSIAQGTGTGGIVTLASSYCEVVPFVVPSPVNDISIVDVQLRFRENGSGSNLFTLTAT